MEHPNQQQHHDLPSPTIDNRYDGDTFTRYELQKKIADAQQDIKKCETYLQLYYQRAELQNQINSMSHELNALHANLRKVDAAIARNERQPETFVDHLRNYAPPVVNRAMDYIPKPIYSTVNKFAHTRNW